MKGIGLGAQFLIFDFFVVCSALLLLIVGLGEKVAFSSTVRPIIIPPSKRHGPVSHDWL